MGCKVLGFIPYLGNYKVLDLNPERDKLAECEVLSSNYVLDNYEVMGSNSERDKILVLSLNPKSDTIPNSNP